MLHHVYLYVLLYIQCEQDLSVPADQGPVEPQVAHEVPRRQH